jgi:uncharacterized protein (DUF433 family)
VRSQLNARSLATPQRPGYIEEDRAPEELVSLPSPLITTSPDRLSGVPVFAGTRVPVQTLIEYIEGGDLLDEFLDDFPSVSREHALAVLEVAKAALLAHASAA